MWREFGAFLKTNGAAVYGSRAWKVLGEGRMKKNNKGAMELITFPRNVIQASSDQFKMTSEDIRFTEGRDGTIYAFVMAVPKPGEKLLIKSLGADAKLIEKKITEVSLLGSSDSIEWKQEADGLSVRCPDSMPSGFAVIFRITTH
jgi:alpha-L-fucosidase